jgi:hypothetical protein
VDRSLRRLGQLLVVMGALLGAVLGVSLALMVENAETSGTVAGPGPEGAAVLAASSPGSQPPASRGPDPRVRRLGAVPPPISAPGRPAVLTSAMARPTRTVKGAGTSPAAARTNPARASNWTLASCAQRVAITDGVGAGRLHRDLRGCPGRFFRGGCALERRAAPYGLRADVGRSSSTLSPSQLLGGDGRRLAGFGAWLAAQSSQGNIRGEAGNDWTGQVARP